MVQSLWIVVGLILWVVVSVAVIVLLPPVTAITPALWLHLTAGLWLLFLIKRFGGSIKATLHVYKTNLKWFLLATAIAVVYWFVDYWAMKNVFNIDSADTVAAWHQANSTYFTWSVFLSSVIMAPLFEELFFRGLVFHSILRRYNLFFATLISALFFALIHWSWPAFISLTAAGLIYALLAHKSNSVITPIIAHMAHNLMTFYYVF